MTKETWRDVILKGPGPQNKKEAIILYVKGLIMGAADLVPVFRWDCRFCNWNL